jgi:hypothetical protein
LGWRLTGVRSTLPKCSLRGQHLRPPQGDWEDRQKLRELEKEKNQTQREQAREDAQKAAWSEEDEDVEESGDTNEFDEAQQFMKTNARVTIAGGSSDKNKDATPKSLLNKDGKTDKRVTFDDVAGIGEAKVCIP